MTIATKLLGILAASLLCTSAFADTAVGYRIDGSCTGDFDQVQLKDHWLRADSHQGSDNDGSMIYDGAEKLAYFLDHRAKSVMQIELDEDAIDLQKDIMTSLGKKMRHEAGIDPFEMAAALCPGLAESNRDRQPDEPVDCGNATPGGGAIGADGKPASREQIAAAMRKGQMPAMDADSQELMQKMMEQMSQNLSPEQQAQMQSAMASSGAAMRGTPAQRGAPKPQRIDRDAGDMTVGEITCARRQHLRGEEMLGEDCYAPVASLKLADVEARRLARFSKSLQDWAHSMTPGRRAPADDDRVLIRRTCYQAGRESGHATLAIDHAPIAESRFAVPAGYAPLDLGQGLQPSQRQQ